MKENTVKMSLGEGEILLREELIKFPSSPSEKPRLAGSKCKRCGDVSFPAKVFCGKCEHQEMEKVLLSNRAKVYTYTVVRVSSSGFEAPYIMAMVKVPDDEELLIVTRITDCEPEKVKIGMDVELAIDEIRKDKGGNKVIGYTFRPVDR